MEKWEEAINKLRSFNYIKICTQSHNMMYLCDMAFKLLLTMLSMWFLITKDCEKIKLIFLIFTGIVNRTMECLFL